MFALWYLSLAVDEMRKHFGWTFFDIFYKNSQAATPNKALDNKPSIYLPKPSETSVPSAPKSVEKLTPTRPEVSKSVTPPKPTPSSATVARTVPVTPLPVVPKPASEMPVPEALVNPTPVEVKPTIPASQLKTADQNVPSTSTQTGTNGSFNDSMDWKLMKTSKLKEYDENLMENLRNASSDFLSGESVNPVSSMPAIPKPACKMPGPKGFLNPTPVENEPTTPPVTTFPVVSKPEFQPETFDNPTSVEFKPIIPVNPLKTVDQNIHSASSQSGTNGSLNDLMDRKLMETSKLKENGENLRQNLKSATSDFLSGEAMVQSPPKISKLMAASKQDTMVDAAVLTKLEEGFAKLAASNSKSLLKKYLTKEVFDNLKNKKTPSFGSTLLDCIQSGLENHDSGVGIYAPDAEAYTVFAELFDPVIEDYHTGFKKTDKHPARDFGDVSIFTNLDPNNEFVISTRVRCGRSMQGYPFNPCLTEAQYKEMEEKVSSTLSGMEGELKGKFYPLTGMEKAVQQQLIDDHFLFKEGDRFLQSANACRYWPAGRGIYHNDNKTFLVWCNEEDHLRIISMQMGGDLGQVYKRLVSGVNDIEKRIPFSHDDRLGFLTFCPTNLGTTIRASVHIKVPKLASNMAKLEEVAGKYNLQVRGTRGEHTEAEGGIYDISNKRRMGLTEFQAVKEMYDGIAELIKIEKSM